MGNCLVMTSDERFWTEDPLVFMDRGCLRYSQKERLQNRNYTIHESRWANFGEFDKSNEYLINLQDRIRDSLGSDLNRINSVNYDCKSWNILLGWWLKQYLGYVYYKYEMISEIAECYSDLYAMGPGREEAMFLHTTRMSNIICSESDEYNGIIGSRICQWLGITVRRSQDIRVFGEISEDNTVIGRNKTHELYRYLLKAISSKGKCVDYQYVIELEKEDIIRAILRREISFISQAKDPIDYASLSIFEDDRRTILNAFSCENDFERMICSFIKQDLPMAYLEAFGELRKAGENYFGKDKHYFLSHDAWYIDEIAKAYMASQRERGTKICGIQHGGSAVMKEEAAFFDIQCVDIYYTWGWTVKTDDCIIKPMPSPKLSLLYGKPSIGSNYFEKKELLYIGICTPRYIYNFRQPICVLPSKYLDEQVRIFSYLEERGMKFRARISRLDFGWDCRDFLQDRFPKIIIEDWNISLERSCKNARLCIIDNFNTTWLEAYISGTPFIFIIPQYMESYREEVYEEIESLKKAGIYYNNAEEAIDSVCKIINQIEEWWSEPERKNTIKTFAEKYVYYSSNWKKEWYKEIVNNMVE